MLYDMVFGEDIKDIDRELKDRLKELNDELSDAAEEAGEYAEDVYDEIIEWIRSIDPVSCLCTLTKEMQNMF